MEQEQSTQTGRKVPFVPQWSIEHLPSLPIKWFNINHISFQQQSAISWQKLLSESLGGKKIHIHKRMWNILPQASVLGFLPKRFAFSKERGKKNTLTTTACTVQWTASLLFGRLSQRTVPVAVPWAHSRIPFHRKGSVSDTPIWSFSMCKCTC